MSELGISERRACRALGQYRSTQRKIPTTPDDEAALTADIIELARQYGRYGYRRITALLRRAGWTVNKKRVERVWRCEGLKVPTKQPKRGRLWLNDGSCIRLRPKRPMSGPMTSLPIAPMMEHGAVTLRLQPFRTFCARPYGDRSAVRVSDPIALYDRLRGLSLIIE